MSQENLPEALIELPQSHIAVYTEEIVVRSAKGGAVGRHALEEIKEVESIRKLDPVAGLFVVLFLAASVTSRIYISSQLWGWIACGIFGAVSAFCLLLLYKFQIKFAMEHGPLVYDVMDSGEELEGFVVSLRSILNRKKKQESASVD
jgi:hypothetical protein